jgi:hypothetical protein
MFAGSGYRVTADPQRSLLKSLLKDWEAVRMVGPGAPVGSKGTMYEERVEGITGVLVEGKRGKQLLVRD